MTTDLDDNQIWAFHPGRDAAVAPERGGRCRRTSTIGIVAPDGRDGMIQHAAQFAAAGIPFIFDPGQGLPMFGGEELRAFIEQATWVAVNDYEWQVVQQKTGWTRAGIAAAGRRADRDARRGRLVDLRARAARSLIPMREARRRSSTRPAAATPTGRA